MKLRNIKPLLLILAIQYLCFSHVAAQIINQPQPFYNYYYDYKLANPAFTSFEDQLRINLTYSGFPKAEQTKLKQGSVYFSYESQMGANSGLGMLFKSEQAFLAQPYQGVAIFFRHKVRLGEQCNVRFGTQLSYFRLTEDRPYLDHNEIYNLDMGIVFDSPWITLGGSIKNLFQPSDFLYSYMTNWEDRPDMNIIATRKFNVTNWITATPSLFFRANEFGESLTINGVFEIKKLIILGASYGDILEDDKDLSLNAGINLKDRIQFIVHLYSSWHEENREYYSGDRRYMEAMLRFSIPEADSK